MNIIYEIWNGELIGKTFDMNEKDKSKEVIGSVIGSARVNK